MTAEQMLEALRPHLKRGEGQLVVETKPVKVLVSELLASKSAPELYEMIPGIGIVIKAISEQAGGTTAATQLRTLVLGPVLAAVVQRRKAERAERRVRASKRTAPAAMERPKSAGVKARKR